MNTGLRRKHIIAMQESYRKKLTANINFLLGANFYVALEALQFGRELHNGDRKDGSPEFIHQLTMTQFTFNMIGSLIYPEETIATFYLHDVPEDKGISHEIIRSKFGDRIAQPVYLMDKNRLHPHKLSPDEYYGALSDCPIGSAAKSVDRCHNLATMMNAFTDDKQREYVAETEGFVLPMLKQAFRSFPKQASFYGIVHHTMRLEVDLLKHFLNMD